MTAALHRSAGLDGGSCGDPSAPYRTMARIRALPCEPISRLTPSGYPYPCVKPRPLAMPSVARDQDATLPREGVLGQDDVEFQRVSRG